MKKTILTVLALTCLGINVRAANLPDAQLALANAIPSVANVNSATLALGNAAINLQYLGAASTEAYITISATAMTFYTGVAGTLTVDSNIGTAGVVTFASTLSANTIGALCDYINSLKSTAFYKCSMAGAKRSDAPILLADETGTAGTHNMSVVGGQSFGFEGASAGGDGSAYIMRLGFTPPSGRRVVLRKCNAYTNQIGTLKVYGKLYEYEGAGLSSNYPGIAHVSDSDSTLVWNKIMADATLLTEDWSLTGDIGGGIEFAKDAHVVVSAGNATSIQAAADYLNCLVEYR